MFNIEKAKEKVAEVALRMWEMGLTIDTWGNVSCKPDSEVIVITPSGLEYTRLKFVDMVVVDFRGTVLEGRWPCSTEFSLHRAIYEARKDVKAIVHTHSVYAMSFAVSGVEIPPILDDFAQVIGSSVPVAGYALPGTDELATKCVDALGDRCAVLLANHGLVGVASTLDEALKICRIVEQTARVYLYAWQLGEPGVIPSDKVMETRRFYIHGYSSKGG